MLRVEFTRFLIHNLNFARLFARPTPVFLLKKRPSFARLFTKMSPSEELVTLVKTWRLTEIIWQQNKSVGKPGASPELLSVPLQVICRSGHVLKTAVWGTLGQ